MRNLSSALLAALPVGAVLAACGSTSTTTPTALTPVTTANTLSTLSTRQVTGPVLNVTQLGFQMTFPAQLGTVNYQIDGSGGGGGVTNYNGVSARFVATVNLFTSLYAAQCAPASSTTTSSTGTSTAPVPLAAPTATPVGSQNPVEAQILVWDSTNASSLAVGPGGGPDVWVRAGAKLLGFRNAPGFSGCGTNQLTLDLPLLREMFLTARAD